MRVHLYATEPHYRRHVQAVWWHLPEGLKGSIMYGRAATPRGLPDDDVVMVGSFIDVTNIPHNRLIYVEHGAGQSYAGANHADFYHGGAHPERVIGYICPRRQVAEAWGRSAVAVGCPAIDAVHADRRLRSRVDTAVITFHWDAFRVCPEARSAREHWLDHLLTVVTWLRDWDYEVIGHWHPRDRDGAVVWKRLNVERVASPDEALRRATLLLADNTSLMYEAAALDIPVIALNAPWYRKDVHHGLRFWDAIPGDDIDSIDELLAIDLDSYVVRDSSKVLRHHAVEAAYDAPPTGYAGQTAATWVTKLVGAL